MCSWIRGDKMIVCSLFAGVQQGTVMNVALFLLAIIVSFVVVRIGAIIFEFTGLEWSLAF